MPTLITSYFVNSAARDISTLTTPSFTPSNGEVLVVKAAADGATPAGAATGGSLTYTSRNDSAVANNSYVSIWTAVVSGSPGSMTVAVPFSGSISYHSIVVERFSGASLAVTPATNAAETGTGAPSATVTTTAANSVVSWVDGDWNAVAPGTPAYRSSATQTGLDNRTTSFYAAYYAYQDAATAGAQTIGMTAPTGQKWSMVGIEILDAGGGGGGATAIPGRSQSYVSRRRAANW